jgi:hypothetical protein
MIAPSPSVKDVSELARLLSAEYLVPVDNQELPAVASLHGALVLPAFASEQDLPPELPPGSQRWEKLSGHLILACLPYEGHLYLAGSERLIPVSELLGPMLTLLEAAQDANPDRLLEAFCAAIVYCVAAADIPGYLTQHDGSVAVFSSLNSLFHGFGESAWFAATGADLMETLPAGHQFVLDPGSPHEAAIPYD